MGDQNPVLELPAATPLCAVAGKAEVCAGVFRYGSSCIPGEVKVCW